MKNFSLRFYIAIVTFIIGVFGTSIWFYNNYSKVPKYNIPPVNISTDENKKTLDGLNKLLEGKEMYDIYSATLSAYYGSEIIVVEDNTSGLEVGGFYYSDNIPEDIVKDYKKKWGKRIKLVNNFNVKSEIALISKKEKEKIFTKSTDGRKKFHEKYSKANEIISFSRIGFNQDYTQALVSISGNTCGSLCGNGGFVFLEKEGGKWIVKRKIEEWVS